MSLGLSSVGDVTFGFLLLALTRLERLGFTVGSVLYHLIRPLAWWPLMSRPRQRAGLNDFVNHMVTIHRLIKIVDSFTNQLVTASRKENRLWRTDLQSSPPRLVNIISVREGGS